MRLVDLHILTSGLLVVRHKRCVVVLVKLAGHVVRHIEQRGLRRSQPTGGQGQRGQKGLEFQRSCHVRRLRKSWRWWIVRSAA
ncbi:hypothetical protein D3C72_2011920 [compost metagenome]